MHPRLLRKFRYADASFMIDVISKTWLEIAERVIRKSRKMHYSIEAFEIIDFDISRILVDGRHMTDFAAM